MTLALALRSDDDTILKNYALPRRQWAFLFLAGLLQYARCPLHGQNCCEGETIWKNSIFADARRTAPILTRIPAVGAMVSGTFVRHRAAEIRRRKSVGSARRARIVEVDSRPSSRESSAFRGPPGAAGGSA